MMFLAAVFAVAVLSGATASLVGFGIGSMLTPLLALRLGMDTAVAAVALPHAVATAIRCWRLRPLIDWTVLKRFGVERVRRVRGRCALGPATPVVGPSSAQTLPDNGPGSTSLLNLTGLSFEEARPDRLRQLVDDIDVDSIGRDPFVRNIPQRGGNFPRSPEPL